MFLGHFAVGFASKRAAPRTSLGTLLAAACFPDLLWPLLLLTGVEKVRIDPGNTAFTPLDFVSYPISHSLLMVAVWALLVGTGYRAVTGYGRGAAVLALGVVSHWILDAATHHPDMPLLPWEGSTRVGLGLWNSIPATLVVESVMFLVALEIYQRGTRARDGFGKWGYLSFVAVIVAIYVANLVGPPPPSETALAWVALGLSLFLLWAAWFDRHREPVGGIPAGER
jgi:membrane-bound metal-dependent hydrolase YbcI (DUF457 family)